MTLMLITNRREFSRSLKKDIHKNLGAMGIERPSQLYQFLFTQMYVQDMADWDDRYSKSDIPVEES